MLLLREDESFLSFILANVIINTRTGKKKRNRSSIYGRPVFPACAFVSSETNLLDKSRGEKE